MGTRDDLFKRAKELRKSAKEQKANGNFSNEDYEQIAYTSIPSEGLKVFRIFGDPLDLRSKPSDPKLSYISMILGDNNKKFRCIWPSRTENKNWILWKIFDTVMDGTWEKGPDNKNVKVLKYAKTHPECVRRIEKNNSDNKFESGWYPTKFVNMNIIDRHDPKYHSEKKHSKLLSKRASEIGDSGNFWFDPGIPLMTYNNVIWDEVVEFSGRWDAYDIAIKKEKSTPWYRAFSGVDDINKINALDAEAAKLIVDGPMTAEEEAYELYDLDRLFKVTSYAKIKAKLGDFIKKVDVDFGKNFTAELEELVKKEQAEYEARKKEKEAQEAKNPKKETKTTEVPKTTQSTSSNVPETLKVETPKDEEPTIRSRVVKSETKAATIDWDKLSDGTFNGTKYVGVKDMTDEEKSMVVSVKDDGSFEYVVDFKGHTLELMDNPRSSFMSPDLFHVDPLNGDLF